MRMEKFWDAVGVGNPYEWQKEFAEHVKMGNALIRIPTGFGKTLGVLLAWLWNRMERKDDSWPRRLVWCFPMRVLVGIILWTAKDAVKVSYVIAGLDQKLFVSRYRLLLSKLEELQKL